MGRNASEALHHFDQLPPDEKELALAFMRIISGQIPEDPLTILTLNRHAIKMQMNGHEIPIGLMPGLSCRALRIIDSVPDLADRRILMSYYWHAVDVKKDKVPGALKRAGEWWHV